MTDEVDDLLEAGRELAALGLSPGTSGNVSVRVGDDVLLSASGTSLATLDRSQLARFVPDGAGYRHAAGPRPTKEFPLHLALYARDEVTRFVIHLHSPYAVAASCLSPWAEHTAFAPITPYLLMRVGNVPLVGYAPPGDQEQADRVRRSNLRFHAVLLQNHGPVVAGATAAEAMARAVEVEEAARTRLLLGDRADVHLLDDAAARNLAETYGQPWGAGGA